MSYKISISKDYGFNVISTNSFIKKCIKFFNTIFYSSQYQQTKNNTKKALNGRKGDFYEPKIYIKGRKKNYTG